MALQVAEYAVVTHNLPAIRGILKCSSWFMSSVEPLAQICTERGKLFIGPGVDLYKGQIIGEHCRSGDLVVNPAKGKKLSNVRASGTDDAVILTPPKILSLEDYLSFINDDELVPNALPYAYVR